jgi:hypothetical protein
VSDSQMCYWPTTDDAFFRWMAAHPAGFVLNVERVPRPAYMVLHQAGCLHIASFDSGEPGAFTTRQYRKVCAHSVEALRLWVADHGSPSGAFSQLCSTCKPRAALARATGLSRPGSAQ